MSDSLSNKELVAVGHHLAKALEEKGLWRRAAAVYSDMFGIACSSVEVSRIAKRRKECLRMAERA